MIFIQYFVKLCVIVAFSYKLWEASIGLIQGDLLFSLSYGLYSLIFLFFALIYKPIKRANTSFFVTSIIALHVASPLFFNMTQPSSYLVVIVGYAFMCLGFIVSVFAVIDLGKSFDVFPVHKGVVTKGMYKYVRHPIYSGYVLTAFGTLASSFSIYNLFIFFIFIVLTTTRISFEEKELLADVKYREFQNKVTNRIFPKIY